MSKMLSVCMGEEFEKYVQELLDRQTNTIVEKLQTEVMETKSKELSELRYKQDNNQKIIEKQKEQIELLKKQVEHRENELDSLRTLLERKMEECKQSYYEKEKIESQLTSEKEKISNLEKAVQSYKENYEELEGVYLLFTKLTENTQNRLSNVFEKKDFISFIVSGVQWDNIEGLWNFIKRKVIEEDDNDTDHLIKIFLFLFSIYSNRCVVPDYYIIQPDIGEKYNREKHSILGIETDGYVKQIKLPGYGDRRRVIGKALIKV